ncbi:MAG: rRNA maturation RNase YbeY [Candidatus Acidiferrum sp.]
MIVNRQRTVRLAQRPLESFLRRVRKELSLGEAEVTVCLVSDAEIARMNEAFRGKKGATDVLSFPSGGKWRVASGPSRKTLGVNEWRVKRGRRGLGGAERKGKNKRFNAEHPESAEGAENSGNIAGSNVPYLGDIAIAPRTAQRYARKHGRSLGDELRVLMLHGVLHLLGYDHETDRGEMNRIEMKLRKRLGLA